MVSKKVRSDERCAPLGDPSLSHDKATVASGIAGVERNLQATQAAPGEGMRRLAHSPCAVSSVLHSTSILASTVIEFTKKPKKPYIARNDCQRVPITLKGFTLCGLSVKLSAKIPLSMRGAQRKEESFEVFEAPQ